MEDNKLNEFAGMPFADFATALKPSGAVNRMPSVGNSPDVNTFSVYLNGPLAAKLPAEAQEFLFSDVALYALTEKLGLNPKSFRDNLKVAEVVATREAWMRAVVEASKSNVQGLSDKVMDDYAVLANNKLDHPWITKELDNQRALSAGLQPALDKASATLGKTVQDVAPREVSKGKVVSKTSDFTIQSLMNGEVITHENRRLQSVPEVGDDVTITYYRGSGQVFDNREKFKVSAPYVDAQTGDLAVKLHDRDGRVDQVVLFNDIASFSKFVTAQGLDAAMVDTAAQVRVATPKITMPKALPQRVLASEAYIDAMSGCLAVDYKEKGAQYSVIFASSGAMAVHAKEYGIDANQIAKGRSLELHQHKITREIEQHSLDELVASLPKFGISDIAPTAESGRMYDGEVLCETALHVAQKVGRGTVMIHDKRELDKLPNVGDSFSVKYAGGLGKVGNLERAQDQALAR